MSKKFTPVIDGKPIPEEKLRYVKFTKDDGEEVEALALLLTAKLTDEGEWFMYVFGSDEKPLIKSQFGGSEEARPEPIALNIFIDEEEEEATLAVTVKEHYEATFLIKK